MRKLTNLERKGLIEAAIRIENHQDLFACSAINSVTHVLEFFQPARQLKLSERFQRFYGKQNSGHENSWLPEMYPSGFEAREIRIMWLLWFAEVG